MNPQLVIYVPKLEAIRRFAKEVQAHVELKKALNLRGTLKEGMAEPRVFERFPDLEDRLREGVRAQCVLMMVDLSPFSKLARHLSATEIARFLDGYYRLVVERVESAGGVVEKYVGDAVIAIFGQPFTEKKLCEVALDVIEAAQDLIIAVGETFEGEVVGKIALSNGSCFIGHVGPDEHRELTIVGNPLTTLIRLEDVCPQNAIIAPSALFVREWRDTHIMPGPFPAASWVFNEDEGDIRDVGAGVSIGILQWRGFDG